MARGDVLLVHLPPSGGREQSGRRPAVVVQAGTSHQPLLMTVPITSNLAALKYPFSLRVEPSLGNGLIVPSVVMIFQMRAIDRVRIIRKLGKLSLSDMARIDAEIWRMLKPPA